MTAHKHAEFLHAVADGDDITEWECRVECAGDTVFDPVSGFLNGIAERPNDWEVRRKPKTIRIGDMDVPKPMRVAPSRGTDYWVPDPSNYKHQYVVWANDDTDKQRLLSGMCHATEEGARLHRVALIKISGGTS